MLQEAERGLLEQLDSIDGQEENKSVYGVKQRVNQASAAMDPSSPPPSFQISAVNQGDEWDRYGLKMMRKGKTLLSVLLKYCTSNNVDEGADTCMTQVMVNAKECPQLFRV